MSDIQRYLVIETALCIGGKVLDGEVEMVRASEHDLIEAELGGFRAANMVLRDELKTERLRADIAVADANDAERELAALREELERVKGYMDTNGQSALNKHREGLRYKDERDALQRRLTAAEQRNAGLVELLQECVNTVRFGEDFDLPVTTMARIDAALNPTESGANE